MKEKTLNVGDKVILKTRDKDWTGNVLESHDSEVILLKLESGYNIGLREESIIDVKVLLKAKPTETKEIKSEQNSKLKNIAMIITGGTISSRLDPKTGAVKWTSVEDLFTMAPELKEICNITKIEKPFMKGSEDMSMKYWAEIAEIAEKLLNDETIDGLIITHGTDTLHFGSAALSFYLGKLNKPLAFTYSQRSIDRGSTDAHLNLICAAKYAISDIAEVAIIGHENLDDEFCLAMPGTKVRKMHSSRRDAFKVINSEPLARISKEDFKILKEFNARGPARSSHGESNEKIKVDIKYTPFVTMIKIHPGQSPEVLDFYKEKGFRGIILETTGLGHVPGSDSDNNWLPTIKRLVKDGMTICATAQTIYGSINMNVYSNGRDLEKTGIIDLKDMLSETAFVKLSWVLGHKTWSKDSEKIKEEMLKNISGEFNDKLGLEF
ncbi:Glu-tRNA(Gln) amidotransferase subunit GatD [archaeon]|nr:Glu-tRNA(Gln) amidotransferase subunit GatD [archaeon]